MTSLHHLLYTAFFPLLLFSSSVSPQATNDLTRVPEAEGALVVSASLALIQGSCVFSHDFLFLRRLAYVASSDGTSPNTYRPGYHGGIWQISEENFTQTHHVATVDYDNMLKALQVNWTQAEWSDLRKPLYSGIAAMLTLERFGPIPRDATEQAEFYEQHLGGQAKVFTDAVSKLSTECESRNLDMAFVLDSSASLSIPDFIKSKTFSANIMDGFKVGFNSVHVAAISFSRQVKEHFNFQQYNSTSAAQQGIRNIAKYSAGTNTHLALDYLREHIFTSESGSRQSAAKIAIVQTDGVSHDPRKTAAAASALRDIGVVVLSIGVGSGIDVKELHAIASPPSCSRVRVLKDFSELTSMLPDIRHTACDSQPQVTAVRQDRAFLRNHLQDSSMCATESALKSRWKPWKSHFRSDCAPPASRRTSAMLSTFETYSPLYKTLAATFGVGSATWDLDQATVEKCPIH
ncbi:uncharacterized protein LOC101857673 [Aplysia californica]|uniref:Uncharacterized protein LOC101857673 n=1 Tax=Aplysia californica TaxID=6500 RepID=A0ABM0K2Q7_APLCA|nr:uncharacterized protein LOC101857673 [Aplysia californica]